MIETLKKLFSSLRTNGLVLMGMAQLLNAVGVDVSVDKIGTDLDTLATAIGAAVSVAGIVRDYVRKFRKPATEKK